MLLTPFRDHLNTLSLERHPELVNWARGRRGQGSKQVVEGPTCSLVGRLDSNYFHWLVDTCTVLEGLEAAWPDRDVRPRLIVRAGAPTFARESLEILGWENLEEWPLGWRPGQPEDEVAMHHQHVESLVIPSWRHSRYGLAPRALSWLRTALLERVPASPGPPERLYIDRSSRRWRSVVNEEEVMHLLAERGFRVVRPEQLTMGEQIQLFRRAEVIVGLHGAGLANLLFAPSAHLVELIGDYGGDEYFAMACALGNTYTRVRCASSGEDVTVDTRVLADALAESPA
jgi:hypothetical protein